MDFSFDEGQELFKRSARKFFETYGGKSTVCELEASETGFSASLWKEMADLGWMGVLVPAEYGGLESGLLELAVLVEEMGRAAFPSPFLCNVGGTSAILRAGSREQKERYLPAVARGELILTTAAEEPSVNYDLRWISTRASDEGGQYSLEGTKSFVPYATVADLFVVAARTSGEPGEATGLTLFLVDRRSPGLTFSSLKTIGGDRQFEVRLAGVRVPRANVLGEVDGGLLTLAKMQKTLAALQCAEMVGCAQKELEMTADYVKVRRQFDRPIGSFQAVQHRAADMFIDVSGARLVTYKALWSLSEGMDAEREVSLAKYITSRTCQRVAFSAQHLHGGIGVTLDYDLHFYYRRAKAFELKSGTQAWHLRKLGAML